MPRLIGEPKFRRPGCWLGLLVLLASLVLVPPAGAARAVGIEVDGRPLAVDSAPLLDAGRVLLPFRAVGEALGANVTWEEATGVITAGRGEKTVQFRPGNRQAQVDGRAVDMGVPARLSAGRAYVPVRFVGESLGVSIAWDEAAYKVRISTGAANPGATGGEIALSGSETFRNKVSDALYLLAALAPVHYAEVTEYLNTISEGDHSGVDVFTRNFSIGSNTIATADHYWLASIIVHDAHHARLYAEGRPFAGEAAEAECIARQKEALLQMEAPAHYQTHLDQVLATRYWEVPYDNRNW